MDENISWNNFFSLAKPKSKFQKKLEEMQRKQEQQMKNRKK